MMRALTYIGIMMLLFSVLACKRDKPDPDPIEPGTPSGCNTFDYSNTTPYQLDIPPFIPPMNIPTDNPLTQEGVELGRFLFWDKSLSSDGTISCGSCHLPEFGFSDPNTFSTGVGGAMGTRNSMALVNLGWANFFFWDGRAVTLEEQVFHPILDPVEMNESVQNVVQKVQLNPMYPPMFEAAFGTQCVDSARIARSVAQFMRTLVSFNSDFDKAYYGTSVTFTPEQWNGLELFLKEGGDPADGLGGQWGADCFHCHGGSFTFFTDHELHNNGLDSIFTDPGAYAVTGNPMHLGHFKTPTLRNIAKTGPYMHDGRFATLEDVVEHYNSGGVPSATIDPFMKYTQGGLQLSDYDKFCLIEFLKMLTDEDFMENAAFQDPH